MLPTGCPHEAPITRALELFGVAPQVAIEADGWELTMSYAALGMGIAIVNDCCRAPALRCYLAKRRDGYLPPAARKLRDHLPRLASSADMAARS